MHRHPGVLFTVILAALALFVVAAPRAFAHAELVRAEPAPDALLAAPPRSIDLWLSEEVAADDALSVEVLDQSGQSIAVGDVTVDPADARHVRAAASGLATGTFTVVWSNRSITDGHAISGSYAFRVGGSTRAPGAATTDGERPAAWAVVTRWTTFLGAALVAGGFGGAAVVFGGELDPKRRARLSRLVIGGAALGLAASLAEPLLQTWRPPRGAQAPDIAAAVAAMPDAWWLRPTALIAALALGLLSAAPRSERRRGRWLHASGMVLGLAALLGLSLTSHAAGRASWRDFAVASNIVHQWSIALWVGGLAALAIAGWRAEGDDLAAGSGLSTLRRFSRLALGLVLIGVVTGAVNAGFVLPRVRSLWTSEYGDILIVKLVLLLPALVLATFHRVALRRLTGWIGGRFGRTLRLETALVLLVVLGGSSLALWAPPPAREARADRPARLDLRQPIVGADPGDEIWVHLTAQPATAGANAFGVALKNGDGTPAAGDPPAVVRLTFASLDQAISPTVVDAQQAADGSFTATGPALSFDGWWSVDVNLRWLGREDVVKTYYVLLPDPNVHGLEAPREWPTDVEAAALYERAMVSYTSIHRVRYRQLMLDGRGGGVMSDHIVNDGTDGSTPGFYYRNVVVNGWEAIVFSDRMWTRYPGKPWEASDGQDMIPPARWGEEYEGATGFRLGRIEEIDGEPSQVITFVVPDVPSRVVAWYVWWVGLESGRVRRDAMISRTHYMVSSFSDFDADLPVEPPVSDAATPEAPP